MLKTLLRTRVLSSFVASAFLIGPLTSATAQDAGVEGPRTESSGAAQGPGTTEAAAPASTAAASTAPASSAPASPAPQEGAPPPPPVPAEIRFNFKGQTWDQVLDWFSRTTGLPIVRETPVPSGTVDYLSPRTYDLPEALKLLNILLQTQDVMLRVEADRLHLQKLDAMRRENVPTFVDEVPESVTDDQIITLLLPLSNASAEAVAEQLKDLVASYGSVTPLKQQNAVILVETAGQVRRLQRIVEEVDREDVENIVEQIPLRHAKATELIESLKALMGERVIEYVINPQNNQRVKLEENRLAGLTLAADARTNSIIARGTKPRIDRVRETIALLDVPRPGSGPRTVRTVVLGRETAEGVIRKLDALFQGVPKEERPTILPLEEPGRIAVAGDPSAVAAALAAIEAIDGATGDAAGGAVPERAVTRLPLEHLDAAAALAALRPLLTARQQAAIALAAGPDQRSILAAGPAQDLAALEGLLALVDRPAPVAREVRFLDLPEQDASAIAARAEEIDALRRPPGDASALVETSLDAARGQLRVVGSAKAIDRFAQSLQQARQAAQPRAETRQYRLTAARASEVARELATLAPAILDPRDGTPFVAPLIEPVDSLGLLVVTAPAAQLAQLEPVVRTLDRAGDATVRVIRLDGQPAAPLLEKAGTIFASIVPAAERDRLTAPQVEIDEASGSVLLVGRAESVATFERAITDARRLAAPARSGRMLTLRQASAGELVGPLGELLSTAGPQDPSRKIPAAEITPVEALNSLWVVGEPEQLALAEQFLQRLDVPGGAELPPLRLLAVRAADAAVIAELLTRRYAARSAAEQRERPVRVDAEIGGNTLAVTAPPEILAEIESLVDEVNDAGRAGGEDREIRIFSLKVGRAADLADTIDQMFPEPPVPVDSRGRPRPDLKLPREVVVRAHEPTNSLIVDAPGTRMEDFARLVEQLDRQEAAPETEIRTYRLNRGRPEAMASTLRELAANGSLGLASDGRGSAVVSIAVEPNTGSLVVSGPPAIFDRVEQVIESVDGPRPGPATDLRILRLASARADVLEPTLRQILLARMRELVPASAGRPEDLLQITVDRKTNSLVVAAPTPIVELAATLAKELDSGGSIGSSTVRVRPLSFADAAQVATSLAAALPGLTSETTGGPVEVKVIAAPGANALLLVGVPADLDEVEKLVEPLDLRPSTDAVAAESFPLRHANAAEIAPIVQRVLADQQQSDPRLLIERLRRSRGQVDLTPPVRVEADPRSNSLLVSGPAQTVALARTLIDRLDVPEVDGERGLAIFVPAHADPARLAASATRVLQSTRPAGTRSTLELLADPQTAAILVTGTTEEVARARSLLGELDERAAVAAETGPTIEVVPVRHADAGTVAQGLLAVLGDSGSEAPPTIRVDATGTSLLVKGTPAQLARVRDLAGQLDRAAASGSRQVRSIAVDPARADAAEVARLLERMLEQDGGAVEVVTLEELLARYPEGAAPSAEETTP